LLGEIALKTERSSLNKKIRQECASNEITNDLLKDVFVSSNCLEHFNWHKIKTMKNIEAGSKKTYIENGQIVREIKLDGSVKAVFQRICRFNWNMLAKL